MDKIGLYNQRLTKASGRAAALCLEMFENHAQRKNNLILMYVHIVDFYYGNMVLKDFTMFLVAKLKTKL